MVKRVFSIIVAIAVVLSTLPGNAMAAENEGAMTPTRVQSETLNFTNEAAENEAEGWKWTPDPAGGGTLELENCYIQSEITGIFYFDNITEQKSDINIVLRGRNILETTSQVFNPMITANPVSDGNAGYNKVNWIISEDGEGSLETRTREPITEDNSPYAFGGNSITIKSGTITSSVCFCIIDAGFIMENGCFSLKIPEGVKLSGGIYSDYGPVEINGGKMDIDSYVGIYVPAFTQKPLSEGGSQVVNISGGEVNIQSEYVGIWISQDYLDEAEMQAVNISGGKIDCKAGTIGFYCKNVNISNGEGTAPQVNVSIDQNSTYPAIYSRSEKVNISGGIITASAGKAPAIFGLDNENSKIEDSIVISGGTGKVYGTVELEEDLSLPKNVVLTVPQDAVLTIPEGVSLNVPDSSSVQTEKEDSIVNNGMLVLPEGSNVSCTGTGFIQKGEDLYTNNNEKLYAVTIKQNGKEVIEHYKENDVVTFSPEADTDELRFKEWQVVSGAAVINNNAWFTMPAEDITIEAIFERFYKLLVKQPGGIAPPEYYKQDSDVELVPEDAGEDKLFKEWKVTPDGVVQVIDNKFKMPASAVTVESIYEQLYKVTVNQNGNVTEKYYSEGSNVQLVKKPAAEGMEFKEWRVTPGILELTGDSFIMPGYDVSIEAVYGKIPSVPSEPSEPSEPSVPSGGPVQPSPGSTQKPVPPVAFPPYAVPVANICKIAVTASPAEGGTVTGNTEAQKGSSVTVEAVPGKGYVFTGWTEGGKAVSKDAKYIFTAERDITLTAVFKKTWPSGEENTEDIFKGKINAANNIKTVYQVSLPDGWEWAEEDRQKAIPAGGSVNVTANYTATDAVDYASTSLKITVTRDKCVENPEVLYTGDCEHAPGCVPDGVGHTECSICGDIINTNIKVPATGHTEEQVITKAAYGKDGSIVTSCTKCNKVLNETVINAVKSVKLSSNKSVYNNKKQQPGITIKDSSKKLLANGTDYTVLWADGMKEPGIYKIKINFTGQYSGGVEKIYKIIPEGIKRIGVIRPRKNGFIVKWKRAKKYVTGYQIQYSTDKKFKKGTVKKVNIKKRKTTSRTVSINKPKRKYYYVRIRTYKNVKSNGKEVKVFSKWSSTKKTIIKR